MFSLHELNALVVEPSATQAKIITGMLTRVGVAHCDVVADGKTALETIHSSRPSLVVSAMYLPDMSGADLILTLRADPILASLPFILVSSETRHQLLDPIRQSGVSGILPKPFSEAQLHAALHAVLDYLNVDASLEEAGLELDNLRVLIVDDSQMARKFIRQVLANMGIRQFFEAENGAIAATLLDNNQVDIVVTDYNMPEMDGAALIDYIRNSSWQSSVPVLMVTSEQNAGRLAAVQDLGVTGVCDKPFEPATVRNLLKHLLTA